MNKSIYRFFLVGSNIAAFLSLLAMIAAGGGISGEEIAPFLLVIVLVALLAHLTFVYRFWASLDARSRRMTPGRAIGLLFIPVYNIYWIFHVYRGFATDFNRYIEQQGIEAKTLSEGLLTFLVITMLIPVPLLNWIIQWVAIGRICNGVNAISVEAGNPIAVLAGSPTA